MKALTARLPQIEGRRELADLGSSERQLLLVSCLSGPDLAESTAALLFDSTALQSLLDRHLLYRASGGTVAPLPAVRRRLEPLFDDPQVRRGLHRTLADRVLAANRKIPKKERLPLMAHHYREAGSVGMALRATLALGRFLKAYYRHAESVRWLESLLPLVREGRQQVTLLEALRSAADSSGDQGKALRTARELARLAPNAETLGYLGYHARSAGRLTEAERALDRALALGPSLARRADLLAHRAHVRSLRGHLAAAAEDLRELESFPRECLTSSHHRALGNHCIGRSEFEKALAHYRESIRLGRNKEDGGDIIEGLGNAALAATSMRSFEAARRFLQLARKLARARSDRWHLAALSTLEAKVESEEGNPKLAYRLFVRAIDVFEALSIPSRVAEAAQNTGYLALELDRVAEAERWSRRAIAICSKRSEPRIRVRAMAVLAQALARGGRFREANDLLAQLDAELDRIDYGKGRQFVLRARLEVARESGRWKQVLSLGRIAERNAVKLKDLTRAVEFRAYVAEALARLGKTGSAAELLDSVRSLEKHVDPQVAADARIRALHYRVILGKTISHRELTRVGKVARTPRRRARWLRLKSLLAPSPNSGMAFALGSYRLLCGLEAGRDGFEIAESAGDLCLQGDRRKEALQLYRQARLHVGKRIAGLTPSSPPGDLREIAERLEKKVEGLKGKTISTLEEIAGLDEMISRGARVEVVLSQVLRIMAGALGVRAACVARSSRGSWKILAARGLEGEEKPPLEHGDGSWCRRTLTYRGESVGFLAYERPERPPDRSFRSIVDILSARAAEAVRLECEALRDLQRQVRKEQERRTSTRRTSLSSAIDDGPFSAFRGSGPAREEIVARCLRAAPTEVSVLLLGETGTGKEILARAVHLSSARARGPFVIVSCASLAQGVLESDLFGHERGAFSGADRTRPGLIRSAERGTLFLDGVDEISSEGQAALLRVLEERRVRAVGGVDEIPVDFRLVCSASLDLSTLVEEGRFRSDLRHRLEGVLIRIPPLRDRKEDIPTLVEHLRQGRGDFTADGLAALVSHDWPGNVRELRNVVSRLLVEEAGPIDAVRVSACLAPLRSPAPSERDLLAEVVSTSPTMTAAAQRVGCSRATLYRRLRRYGLAPRVSRAVSR